MAQASFLARSAENWLQLRLGVVSVTVLALVVFAIILAPDLGLHVSGMACCLKGCLLTGALALASTVGVHLHS